MTSFDRFDAGVVCDYPPAITNLLVDDLHRSWSVATSCPDTHRFCRRKPMVETLLEARALVAGLLAAAMLVWCCDALAVAPPDTKGAENELAMGNAAAVLKSAEDVLASAQSPAWLFIKAWALYRLGRIDESWAILNVVRPGDLPERLQDGFVTVYEACEKKRKEIAAKKIAAARAEQAARNKAKEAPKWAPPVSEKPAPNRTAAWFWTGGGGLLLLGGAVLGVMAYSAHGALYEGSDCGDATCASPHTQSELEGFESDRDSYALMGGIAGGLGAVALTVGLVKLLGGASEQKVSLTPMAGPRRGLLVSLAF